MGWDAVMATPGECLSGAEVRDRDRQSAENVLYCTYITLLRLKM